MPVSGRATARRERRGRARCRALASPPTARTGGRADGWAGRSAAGDRCESVAQAGGAAPRARSRRVVVPSVVAGARGAVAAGRGGGDCDSPPAPGRRAVVLLGAAGVVPVG